MQYEIVVQTFVEVRKPGVVGARLGMCLCTDDNHLQAACRALRDFLTLDADVSTYWDRAYRYDRVEEMSKRHAARERRRASSMKEKRSSPRGDTSSSGGDASSSGGDASSSRGDAANSRRDASNSRGDAANSRGDADDSVVLAIRS